MPTHESDPLDLLLDTVLAAVRDPNAFPMPRLIVRLRRFNGEFARICTARGLSFDEDGTVLTAGAQLTPPEEA